MLHVKIISYLSSLIKVYYSVILNIFVVDHLNNLYVA